MAALGFALATALAGTASAELAPGRVRPARPVPLVEAPGLVGNVGAGVIAAVWERFGLDASEVPTVVLDGPSFAATYRRITGEPADRVRGFEHRGVVYLQNHVFTVSRVVVAHEVLHALSRRFTREVSARGGTRVVEGVTDYFAHQLAAQRTIGRAGFPISAYGPYERFAAALAALVGEDRLADCYFHLGFDELEREVDARLGRGGLARAVADLERDGGAWPGILAAPVAHR